MTIKIGLVGYDEKHIPDIIYLLEMADLKQRKTTDLSVPTFDFVKYPYPIGDDGADVSSKIKKDNPAYILVDPLYASASHSENLAHDFDNYEKFLDNIGNLGTPLTVISLISDESDRELTYPLKERNFHHIFLGNLPSEIYGLYKTILAAQKPETS